MVWALQQNNVVHSEWGKPGMSGRARREAGRSVDRGKRETEMADVHDDRGEEDEARSTEEYRQRVTISLVVICRQIRRRDNAAKTIMGTHRVPTMGGLSEITMPTRYLL